VKFKVRHV